MTHAASISGARVVTFDAGGATARTDVLAGEEPLQILAGGPGQVPVEVAVTMRTPGHELELAIGFLFSEGLIGTDAVAGASHADPSTAARPDDTIAVHLRDRLEASAVAVRRTVATASCGICGKASIDDIARRCGPLPDGPVMSSDAILTMPAGLRASQDTFDATGGLHASGLFDPDGSLVTLREDVGRHNALDKVIGERYLAGALPLLRSILMLSGRISFELVQKAGMAGIPIVAAIGAPTDLAVATAERVGMTVVGFVRGDRFNVYSHEQRIDLT